MVFIKVVKSKSYFSRYQVKFRRRRNGLTDYYARRKLIHQDKNKYATKKYRLIARITNNQVICQFAYATLAGDIIVASASSLELRDYGVKIGLTNFAACYCTGLLGARRLLTKLKIDRKHTPSAEFGGDINVKGTAVRACLDVGLARCTTGAKIFGCLKGALDGGVDIPHDVSRYPGYDKEDVSKWEEELKSRIFGSHVSNYMKELQESNPEQYKKQFSQFEKNKISSDSVEQMYKSAHKWIIQNPFKNLNKKKKFVQNKDVVKKGIFKRYEKRGQFLKQLRRRKAIRTTQKIFLSSLAQKKKLDSVS